ncbi:hypothetical protein ACO0K9_11310 [Undibacterium sp. Ji50W]|uniref:hypothetical protein n=1 Tax=Undibacterium sp. Ji50W TaxID=3413041 RepID=UPI003BF3A7D2
MGGGQTKNAALTTALAFHYQVLIGLERCFALQEGQSVCFERDGDVSLVGNSPDESKQEEVKHYADALTDHHENLWKTLSNWLAPEFDHVCYGSLVLHTTQSFGATSSLKNWNQENIEQRVKILTDIFETRTPEELTADKPKPIVQLQKTVMTVEQKKLKEVLSKVTLFTEADDETSIRKKISAHLVNIPKNNQLSYLHGIVGFVYESANYTKWEISQYAFHEKCVELTSTYCRRSFTLPPFTGREATKQEIDCHEEKLFVQKVQCIEYSEVIPDAVGNWIELHNSLNTELDGAPQFRRATNQYQAQLIQQFMRKHSHKKRNCIDSIRDSKNLYDEIISETPAPMEGGSYTPPLVYKNGLIHDAMDNEEKNLHWRVDP